MSFKLPGKSLIPSLVLLTVPCIAATHYVRQGATGNGSGNDWTNAYTSLPSSLVRGDTYFIADGSYSGYTFDDANSGTTVITIRKATSANHGTSTGWSDSYGAGQAKFGAMFFYTDYYAVDGQVRNATWRLGDLNQYGFQFANTRLDNGSGTGGDNLTFTYVDFHGGGRDTGAGDDVIYGLTGNSNLTFQYCALHDSDRTIFLMRGNWTNFVVDHSYLARNTSTPAVHGEILSSTSSTNVTFSNNVVEDPEGTAVWAMLNGGTANGWNIYGNVVLHTDAYWADTGRKSGHNIGISGVVYCANDASNNNTCNNLLAYNNTMYHLRAIYSGFFVQAGSGNYVYNNLWYNASGTAGGTNTTSGWNWYYNSTNIDSSSTKITCSSNCNIFVDITGRDFRLTSPTAAGTSVPSAMSVDPNGLARGADGTLDRGAYEYSSSVTSGPQPPAVVTASVN